jgi:undecaprenyl-diphosphatase
MSRRGTYDAPSVSATPADPAATSPLSRARRLLAVLHRLDAGLYAAVARRPTPALDRWLRRLSHAADYSRLSLTAAAVLSLAGGRRGRRAAADGLAALGVTAAVVNLAVKPLGRRRRPDRVAQEVPSDRHVPMPVSSSFPSGHTAAAFAFASGVAATAPAAARPLRALAALVAYSRVHTGVHYPGDVVIGSLIGVSLARLTTRARTRRRD